jgi:phage terminase large subunit-like protein
MASVDIRYALAIAEQRRRRVLSNRGERVSWFDTPTDDGGARVAQRPPSDDIGWQFWLNLAGRGYGKTRIIVEWACDRAHTMVGSRGMVVGATGADVRDILVEGESGFLACDPTVTYFPGKQQLRWANGSMAYLRSAEKPDRLRGPQSHWMVADELAAWSYAQETWDMAMFGLRLGTNPQCAIATTPRPTKIIRALVQDEMTHVSRGSTYDNRANLAPPFMDKIIKKYEGTRLGRQELNAEILDDVPGAMWTRDNIDENRRPTVPEHLSRVVVAFDPPASETDDSAEAGIVVVARGKDGRGYVLADESMRGSVDERLDAILGAYDRHRAGRVIVERNNGGDWIPHAIKTKRPTCAVATVWASRGKATRAEPVASLYEQHRVSHVGVMAELEDQLCTWTPDDASPDRLDALVWGITELMIGADQGVKKVADVVNLYGSRDKASDKYAERGRGGRRRNRRK